VSSNAELDLVQDKELNFGQSIGFFLAFSDSNGVKAERKIDLAAAAGKTLMDDPIRCSFPEEEVRAKSVSFRPFASFGEFLMALLSPESYRT